MNEQEHEVKIAAGFNAGYVMQKHEPELLKQILSEGNKQSEFVRAMGLGQQEQKREQLIEQQQQVKKQPNRSRSR